MVLSLGQRRKPVSLGCIGVHSSVCVRVGVEWVGLCVGLHVLVVKCYCVEVNQQRHCAAQDGWLCQLV